MTWYLWWLPYVVVSYVLTTCAVRYIARQTPPRNSREWFNLGFWWLIAPITVATIILDVFVDLMNRLVFGSERN